MRQDGHRAANLDLLRVVSMLLIVLLHSIDHSGVLEAAPDTGISMHFYVRFMYMLTQICVNIFVMLSGYFLVSSRIKPIKLIRLWMEVVFYSLLLKVIFMLLGVIPWSPVSILSCFFPFFTGRYWFITIYVGLYILSPFINITIRAMDKRIHAALNLVLCILFSVWNSFFPSIAGMNSGGGWGLAWFVVLYFSAAWFRLYYVSTGKWMNTIICWIGISAVISGLYCAACGQGIMEMVIGNWYKYNSLPAYLSTIAVFVGFLNIKITSEGFARFISTLAASTFGVYLIHAHANVSPWLWKMLDLPGFMTKYTFVFIQLGSVFLIFFVCAGVDLLRRYTIGRLEYRPEVRSIADKSERLFRSVFEVLE